MYKNEARNISILLSSEFVQRIRLWITSHKILCCETCGATVTYICRNMRDSLRCRRLVSSKMLGILNHAIQHNIPKTWIHIWICLHMSVCVLLQDVTASIDLVLNGGDVQKWVILPTSLLYCSIVLVLMTLPWRERDRKGLWVICHKAHLYVVQTESTHTHTRVLKYVMLKCPPFLSILIQMIILHAGISYCLKIYFNIYIFYFQV